jgi:tRNA(fMet)-specific endonuclease VapC
MVKLAYLLDTDICIYITKHSPVDVVKKFQQMPVGAFAMSVVNYGELYFGSEKSMHAKKAHAALEALIGRVPVLPLPPEAATHYGRIRAVLEKQGNIIGSNDLWIAAHCLALNLTLITNNTREFQRVPALRIENWL